MGLYCNQKNGFDALAWAAVMSSQTGSFGALAYSCYLTGHEGYPAASIGC